MDEHATHDLYQHPPRYRAAVWLTVRLVIFGNCSNAFGNCLPLENLSCRECAFCSMGSSLHHLHYEPPLAETTSLLVRPDEKVNQSFQVLERPVLNYSHPDTFDHYLGPKWQPIGTARDPYLRNMTVRCPV